MVSSLAFKGIYLDRDIWDWMVDRRYYWNRDPFAPNARDHVSILVHDPYLNADMESVHGERVAGWCRVVEPDGLTSITCMNDQDESRIPSSPSPNRRGSLISATGSISSPTHVGKDSRKSE